MLKTTVYVFLLFVCLSTSALPETLESIHAISVSNTKDTIIFKFNKIHNYRYIRLNNHYFYIAIPHKTLKINPSIKPSGIIQKIIPVIINGETRVFIKLPNTFHYRYTLKLIRHQYIIVGLYKTPLTKKTPKNKPVVVIDPGHGGRDPGGIGIYNYEKNVVLKIAEDVKHYLEQSGLVKVVMTRTKDEFVSLENRVKIANKVHSAVFVSIHANISPKDKKYARGLMVFFLNATSDKRAIELAALENGTTVKQVSVLNKIIISLIQSTKIQKSVKLARDVYKYTLRYGKLTYSGYRGDGVKQAPFFVLVGTKCPSILIETAFLSNRRDDKELSSPAFRHEIAKGIAKGILLFLKQEHKIK